MGTKDLMIGDWVFKDMNWNEEYPPYNGLDYQLYQIESGDDIDLACETNCIGDESIYQPIPLTPEILELNGFELNIRNGRYYCCINGDDVWVRLPKEYAMYPYVDIIYSSLVHCPEDVTEISHSNELHFPEKAYVHQFQQVLRICGLREFADNFKVQLYGRYNLDNL